ncbi:MAG TPA: plastocyanin/azurin family copper-binding protein [Gemmatimonadaceae bacterium]|nr:plastocyanin/azurin family copper-binding protein [Gemmatimonadaceae bacterium]
MTSRSRREFLKASGLAVAGLGIAPLFGAQLLSSPNSELIEMRSDALGSRVWFDPIGLYVEPGTTVRWITRENVHTTTAYHPNNDHHSLRIPDGAAPWDSGFLVKPGATFDVTLRVPGVYDYYCLPHEAAGMVGRIVVGRSIGAGAKPFDYWVSKRGTDGWLRVPDAARAAFPSVERILAERVVHPIAGQR